MPAFSVTTSGYVTLPIIIEGNQFQPHTNNNSSAIFLSGVAGGVVKENQIIGFKNGINLLWSAMDIYGNNNVGNDEDSKGVSCFASSYANFSPNGLFYTGGANTISTEGEYAGCIESDESFLYLDYGFNTFDIINYTPGNAFHLTGTVNDELIYEGAVDETYNCFMVSETETTAVHNMTWGDNEPVEFKFDPYYCGDNESEGIIAFNLGNGNYDTIYTESSGSGGGQSSITKRRMEIVTLESLSDSVSINLRKRDYERVSELCYELLTDHIDSLKDVTMISKLYLSELKLDSSGNKITNLKSFLESIILNNPENEALIKQSFYVIQKCKVSLVLFQSAMTGFQEIINQNPYSYDGLLASWDYAATSLLDSSTGSGGGIRNNQLFYDSDFLNDDPKDKYDTRKFTTENRKAIRKNVYTSFVNSREKELTRIKDLQQKVSDGKATKKEKDELQIKKTLKEIVKTKKPKNTIEHVKSMNYDIQKVFGNIDGSGSDAAKNSLIPTDYNLSQNYPNPFNPITKINFGLPEDGKTNLIIYDILGREIIRLVNNEFKSAGRYTVEFNGTNLSSGIYFYRLESNKFVQTKRMVLVK